jgi:hypothetical protein
MDKRVPYLTPLESSFHGKIKTCWGSNHNFTLEIGCGRRMLAGQDADDPPRRPAAIPADAALTQPCNLRIPHLRPSAFICGQTPSLVANPPLPGCGLPSVLRRSGELAFAANLRTMFPSSPLIFCSFCCGQTLETMSCFSREGQFHTPSQRNERKWKHQGAGQHTSHPRSGGSRFGIGTPKSSGQSTRSALPGRTAY